MTAAEPRDALDLFAEFIGAESGLSPASLPALRRRLETLLAPDLPTEAELPQAIRDRLAELRACDNLASVTVLSCTGKGTVLIVVPNELAGGGGGWAMPDEPFLMTIPAERFAH